MSQFVRPIAQLIEQLAQLPGIGPKTAQRLAFHLISTKKNALALANAIVEARRSCVIAPSAATSPTRTRASFAQSVGAIRASSAWWKIRRMCRFGAHPRVQSLYHVLHRAISPMDGIGPALRIKELLRRLEDGKVKEVVVATNPTVEGKRRRRIWRPHQALRRGNPHAHGVPVGGDLEYIDEVTLSRALEGRRDVARRNQPKKPVQRARSLPGHAAPAFCSRRRAALLPHLHFPQSSGFG